MPNSSILILLNFYFKLSTLTSQVDNTKNWKKNFSVSSKKYNFENLNKGRLAFQRNILNQIIYNHQIFPLICLLYLYTGVKAQLWRISRNIVSPYEHLNYPSGVKAQLWRISRNIVSPYEHLNYPWPSVFILLLRSLLPSASLLSK